MTSTTPRGIQEISCTLKDDTVKSAHRVRITRQNFKGQRSRVFYNLNEAKEYLSLSKSVQGKKLIYSIEHTEEEKYCADKENRNDFSFENFLKLYIRDYIDTKPRENEIQKRYHASTVAFYNIVLEASILDRSPTYKGKVDMGIGNPEDPVYNSFGKYDIRKTTNKKHYLNRER